MRETVSCKPSYAAGLLWVNHDANNMKAQPHRQRVFTHIQQRYRPWQRRDSALKLRQGVKLPITDAHPPSESLESEEDRSEISGTSPAESCSSTGSGLAGALVGRAADSTNPQSLPCRVRLHRGNSDPFDTYSIKITPRVNDILRFYRDVVIPSQYHTGPEGWRTTKPAAEDWKDVVAALHERGGALGFLSRWAQVASNVTQNPELAVTSLKFRSQSTTVLLQKLQEGAGVVSRPTYWHIIALYMAEAQAGNAQAAWLHASMLYRALKQENQRGQVDITALRSFLYNEAAACCMFMAKPVLDYDDWMEEVFKKPWAAGRAELPALQLSFSRTLDPSIESEPLREMFIRQREGLAVWRHGSERAEGLSPVVFTWWCSGHLVKHTRLLKYALDCIDAAKATTAAAAAQSRILEKNAYLALTAVYWTRLVAGDETLLGKEIYATKRPLRKLTRQLLEKERQYLELELPGSSGMQYQFSNARLWALYIGAQAENRSRFGDLDQDQDDAHGGEGTWFSDEFTRQAARMDLSSWDAVRVILDGFLDCDVVKPHGERFVPALIAPS